MVEKRDGYYLDIFGLRDLQYTEIATKTERTLLNSPSSVTVFTQKEIRAMGIETLEELLNFVPGVAVKRQVKNTRTAHFGGARGVASEILLLYDGIRLNDHAVNSPFFLTRGITLRNIERVEIIRGPSSTLWGSQAVTGLVNLIPSTNLNNASIEGGTEGSRRVSLNWSDALGDLNIATSFHYHKDEGFEFDRLFDPFFDTFVEGDDLQENLDVTVQADYKALSFLYRYAEAERNGFMGIGSFTSDGGRSPTSGHIGSLRFQQTVFGTLESTFRNLDIPLHLRGFFCEIFPINISFFLRTRIRGV